METLKNLEKELEKEKFDECVFKIELEDKIAKIYVMSEDSYYEEYRYRLDFCTPRGASSRFFVEEVGSDELKDDVYSYLRLEDGRELWIKYKDELEECSDVFRKHDILYTISEWKIGGKRMTNICNILFESESEAKKYLWKNVEIPHLEEDDQVPKPFYYVSDVVGFVNDLYIENEITGFKII